MSTLVTGASNIGVHVRPVKVEAQFTEGSFKGRMTVSCACVIGCKKHGTELERHHADSHGPKQGLLLQEGSVK
jgi:hypothetical protein